MDDKPRIFTVAEANALLPRLNVLLERQRRLLEELDAEVASLRARGEDPEVLEPRDGEDHEVREQKASLGRKVELLRELEAEVAGTGAVVKDVREGLVDFYGRVEGRVVWLCWRYGESAVAHWHPLETGFASRRPLPRSSIPPTLN